MKSRSDFPRLIAEIIVIAFGISFSSGLIILGIDKALFPCGTNTCGKDFVAGGISMAVGLILLILVLVLYLWINIPSKEDKS